MATTFPLAISGKEIDQQISAAGRIPRHAFLASIEAFFSLAGLAVIGRMITRIYTRRRWDFDDYLSMFALLCLGASIGLVHVFCQVLFIIEAWNTDPNTDFPYDRHTEGLQAEVILNSFICIIWTTIFTVKFSFLALFRLLIRRLPKPIIIYYWTTVGIAVATWIFFVSLPFILCPHFDAAYRLNRCAPLSRYLLTTALVAFTTCLDIITDMMIISIPIIVLRKTQLKSSQKLGFSVLMGLSVVMVVVALVRISGLHIVAADHRKVFDMTWQIYWLCMEGCIACIMASVAAFRSLFISKGATPDKKDEQRSSYSMWRRLLRKLRGLRFKSSRDPKPDEEDQLPVIPFETLSSVERFIPGSDRPIENSTGLTVTCLRGDENIMGPMDRNQIYISNELNITSQKVKPRASTHTVAVSMLTCEESIAVLTRLSRPTISRLDSWYKAKREKRDFNN